ncbi:MAG: hypothetical protein OXC91_03125 [Rhodobacteraceae bacterium]|nr:hypothetical protein [Paracoccaceae bacterium]
MDISSAVPAYLEAGQEEDELCQNARETIQSTELSLYNASARTTFLGLENMCVMLAAHITRQVQADFGFTPPTSPRPDKSLCDGTGPVSRTQAQRLFRKGIDRAMISRCRIGNYPKFIWAVDEERSNRVYEAKLDKNSNRYHGYELGNDEVTMRTYVIDAWNARCPTL